MELFVLIMELHMALKIECVPMQADHQKEDCQ